MVDKVNEFEYGVSDRLKSQKLRFSDEANEHYRYPMGVDLTEDTSTLHDYVKHHIANQRPRLIELEQYYEGKNVTIFKDKRRKEEHYADNRASHNFANYISTFIQGYMTGVPLKTEYVLPEEAVDEEYVDEEVMMEYRKKEEEKVNHAIKLLNRENEADEHNSELVLDQSIFGRAYEIVYRNRESETRFAKLDVKNTFVIYSNSVEKEPIAAVRHMRDFFDENKMVVYLYTDSEIVRYETNARDKEGLTEVERNAHAFGEVPIIEYENNSKRLGDFESVLTLIDLYDSSQSDLANYSQDLNDAMLLIEGDVKLKVDEASEMKKKNIMILRPSRGPQGKTERVSGKYIYKQYDVQGMEAYKDRTLNDIFLISNVPNLLDDSFAGNQSGVALKMKLFGLAQKRATKERKFKKGLRSRYRLIQNIGEVASEMSFDVGNLQITFTENLPRAISQEMEWFSQMGGELSEETLLSQLSFIENPKEEMAKMELERESNQPTMDFETYVEGEEGEEVDGEQEE